MKNIDIISNFSKEEFHKFVEANNEKELRINRISSDPINSLNGYLHETTQDGKLHHPNRLNPSIWKNDEWVSLVPKTSDKFTVVGLED
jgi:hypothetical protein